MYFVLVCQKTNYAVRYLPDSFVENSVLFNRLVSKHCFKWYSLLNIILEGDNSCLECNKIYRQVRVTQEKCGHSFRISTNASKFIVQLPYPPSKSSNKGYLVKNLDTNEYENQIEEMSYISAVLNILMGEEFVL